MGSKRAMLQNGLGELILDHARNAARVVDLFCGAGFVAWFTAENTVRPVLAVDLQAYATTLAQAVIGRNIPLESVQIKSMWLDKVNQDRVESQYWNAAALLEQNAKSVQKLVEEARLLCEKPLEIGPIWNSYGGHYFSPAQAITFDYMIKHLPQNEPERSICLAAAITAASKCVAAPGHTAQPFQPTDTAGVFIYEAWKRDPLLICENALGEICPKHAKVTGETITADALDIIPKLRSDDLVIVDPPYSGVQYSRFYHVLETIARGACGPVSGIGRYPPVRERPQSDYSKKSRSRMALESLLKGLESVKSTVIFTFPSGECSNGLSGDIILETAKNLFDVDKKIINGCFSTMGGNNTHRSPRNPSSELLLVMQPKC